MRPSEHSEPPRDLPIEMLATIANLIDESLAGAREHYASLSQARAKPHVLDDATVSRSQRVFGEDLEWIAVWWLCPVCGHEWQTVPGNRNDAHGSGCPVCTRQRVYGLSLAAARPDLAAELRDIDPTTIGLGSHRRVWWRCSQCAREWEQPPAGRRSHPPGGGCRSCRARTRQRDDQGG
jgi:hypothetical protein